MSIDIPVTMEPEIMQYADAKHITADEAIVRLILTGLDTQTSEEARIDALLGEPMSDNDVVMMDDVVEMAMKARSERWGPRGSA